MLSDTALQQLREELADLYAGFRHLESAIEMEQIHLHSVLSGFPDDPPSQRIAGASAATASKAEMRARIENWITEKNVLRDRILDIEYQLPVHVKTSAPLNPLKKST